MGSEIYWWVILFSHKHEDLGSIPRIQTKSDVVSCVCNHAPLNAVLGPPHELEHIYAYFTIHVCTQSCVCACTRYSQIHTYIDRINQQEMIEEHTWTQKQEESHETEGRIRGLARFQKAVFLHSGEIQSSSSLAQIFCFMLLFKLFLNWDIYFSLFSFLRPPFLLPSVGTHMLP